MRFWLSKETDQLRRRWLKRFSAAYWTVDFARPMMASVVTTAYDALRVDAEFYRSNDLAGLIWHSADSIDHPLLRYETRRDYRGTTLSFRWRSTGLMPLDAVNGPTLTIEGRDAVGAPRAWYVRLWNYATGSTTDALVTIDFDAVRGGFMLPAEADPVWAGDVDRMFISLVPPTYTGAATPLAAPAVGRVDVSEIRVDGEGSTLAVGDAFLPEHRLRAATGYDDQYNLTPARLLRNIEALGYRKWINHYVGMSHYYRLSWQPLSGRFEAVSDVEPFNTAFRAWHADFLRRAKDMGYTVILSLSYELFDDNAPEDWKQRKADGAPALTGWFPPSTLLSPASVAAQLYLERCAASLARLSVAAAMPTHFQVGEPWWWVGPDRAPCIYDAAARTLYTAETGLAVPLAVTDATAILSPQQTAYLGWAGTLLARSTIAVAASARAVDPAATRLLLFYAPQVVRFGGGNLVPLNMPTGWRKPAFDVFQFEDYDFVLEDDQWSAKRARALVQSRLEYPLEEQHYFTGFILSPPDRPLWGRVADAADRAIEANYDQVFVWAMPQVLRDGACFQAKEQAEMSFHDVDFPTALGLNAVAETLFSTTVVTSCTGHESRNINWSQPKMRYEIGSGLRSEADLRVLAAFFRARRGRAYAFRFRDPLDATSSPAGATPHFLDQTIGAGNGVTARFQLMKEYDADTVRRITRPVTGSVRVGVGGTEQTSGWRLLDLGIVEFDQPPPSGSAVTAGFLFDVPVRFSDDNLAVQAAHVRAGLLPNSALEEVWEA